jgi:transglutaminase-like putative cysteine protease
MFAANAIQIGSRPAFIRALFIALTFGIAHARADSVDVAPSTIESDVHRFVVQRDGTLEEFDDTTLRANTASGIDAIAQHDVWFDKDAETLALLTAESIDPDGQAHPVAPEAIRDVQEPRAAGAPMFEDGILRTVIFPGVEPGWRVHVIFRKKRLKPVQPGMFAYFVEPTREPVDNQELIFDLPADMPLFADARGYVARPSVTEGNRIRYEFDYRHGPYALIEHGAVGYAQYGDRLMVTTVPSFAAFADRYREGAIDPSADDPTVVAFARTLTADAPDAWSKARTIYDWMRANIRYVALFVGETAARPHRVIDILHNRYGDCKDHVALFGALLAAVGIRSQPALIGLGPVYTLPSVPGYGTSAINHVIAWIPELQRFADTTAGGTAFGDLPAGVMDRPALLVGDGALVRTPTTQARARNARVQIDVDASGTGRYAYRVEDSGFTAELERNVFRRATRERVQQIAYERLRQTGLSGSATIVTDDVSASAGPFAVTMTGALDHVIWPDGMMGVPALSSFAGGIATQVKDWLSVPQRTQPYVCLGGAFEEQGQIVLPPNARTIYVPEALTVTAGDLSYASDYIYDPETHIVQVTRRLRANFSEQVCSPEQFRQMRAALERIERDALAQIVVRGVSEGSRKASGMKSGEY